MLGTIVNTGCIIVGSVVGSILKKGLGEKYQTVLYNAMGLASLALGANTFVQNMPKSEFPVLFILSIALGGVVGTALDLVTSMVFATTYGIGIIIAAPILFCWQGMFYLIGKFAASSPLLQGEMVNEMAIVGGLLIISSGLSLLKLKDCKTLNYIPALLVPAVYVLVKALFA